MVVRWSPGEPVRLLALRDEMVGRDFDDPSTWWPEQSHVVGGRDRTAGGSWCVTDIATGRTGLVLNRPLRPQADPGAPSRGVLPLLAVRHGRAWPAAIDVTGMAGFSVLLATTETLARWSYDGGQLVRQDLRPGTHMVTSGGAEDGKADRYLDAFTAAPFPGGWAEVLAETSPVDDPAALVVRGQREDEVFATVFGQLVTAVPGELSLTWSRQPWGSGPWTSRTWAMPVG